MNNYLTVIISINALTLKNSHSKCNACKAWFLATRDFLKHEGVKNHVAGSAAYACDLYDLGGLSPACHGAVASYIPTVMDNFVETVFNPEMNCDMLCNEPEVNRKNSFDEDDSDKVEYKHIHHHHVHREHGHHQHPHYNPSDLCEASLELFQKKLNQNGVDEKVFNVASQMCQSLYSSPEKCLQKALEHIGNAFEFLSTLPIDATCDQLANFNIDDLKSAMELMSLLSNSVEISVGENFMCSMCENALDTVFNLLKSQNWDDIKSLAHRFCAQIPEQYSSICNKLIDTAFNDLTNFLKTLSSKDMCSKIGICSGNSSDYSGGNFAKPPMFYDNNLEFIDLTPM